MKQPKPSGLSWRATLFRGGLGRRILLWFLVLSLVPLLLSNTVGYVVTREIIQGQIARYLRALAETQAQQVATEIERHHLFMDGITVNSRPLLRNIPAAAAALQAGQRDHRSIEAIRAHLLHELAEIATLTEFFIVDTAGTVVAATLGNRLGQDWSLSELFRRGRTEPFFTADWDARDERVVPLFRLAVPIRDEERGRMGVLAGTVTYDMLRAFLHLPEHLAIDVQAFIIDRSGRPVFVSHPHRTPVDFRERFPSPLIDRPPGSGVRYLNYEGIEVMGTSIAIPGLQWLFLSEVPVESALGQLRGLALLAATLESVFALLLVGIAWTVAHSIVSPLRRLVVAAEHIRRGELGVEVEIERGDELGDLGRTFNKMSGELRSSARQIRELHEQEMRRAAQLASVGELASGIAHEIKNPLVGVASGIDLLSQRLEDSQGVASILGQIRTQVHRIESAIQDLLSYARPKELRLVWTDPNQLLDRLVTLVGPQAEAAGVQIEEHRADAIPKVKIDPELLTQALVNLALNAIQAMSAGGTLLIALETADAEIHFSISDTGQGIEPEQIEQIFRPFYTTKHQGTGLGLAITSGIVDRHGGRLEVESIPGEGSTFKLVITAKPAEAHV